MARVRYRCTLTGRPPGAPEGVLGWEVRELRDGGERLIGMYFAHRARLLAASVQSGDWMPDIRRVLVGKLSR